MSRLRALLPLLLTLGGFAGMGALFVRKELALTAIGATAAAARCAVAALVYAGWLAWESRVSAREATRGAADLDRGTMELAAVAKYALLFAAVLPLAPPPALVATLGLALLPLGVALRVFAIRALGDAYTHRIRPIAHGGLVARGPYAVVRHPAYLGTFVAHAGLALAFWSTWSMVALALAWLPAVVVRTLVEDRALRASPAYAAYAARVRSRLVVGLF